jgi:hypothetical protein
MSPHSRAPWMAKSRTRHVNLEDIRAALRAAAEREFLGWAKQVSPPKVFKRLRAEDMP